MNKKTMHSVSDDSTKTAKSQAVQTGQRGTDTGRQVVAAFIRLSRPQFLMESMLVVTTGVTVAVFLGFPFAWGDYLLAQGFAWGVHLMVHYCNEYFDLEADIAQLSPTAWTGGSRVLATGQLRPLISLAASFVGLFAVLVLVVIMPDIPARAMALAAVALAWFYTAPPLRLNYRGLGELTTASVLQVLWPALTVYLLAGSFPSLLLAVALPTFLLMTARMMVMNFVDSEADLSVGKRTLPNLLGPRRAATLFATLQVLAYGSAIGFAVAGLLPVVACIVMLLTAVPGAGLAVRLFRDPPPQQSTEQANVTALWATTHMHSATLSVSVGLILASMRDWSAGLRTCTALVVIYLVFFAIHRLRGRHAQAA